MKAKEGSFSRDGQGKPGKRFLAVSEIQLFALLLSAESPCQLTSGQRDDEINLSDLENYTIGHSSDVEHIWFHDDE